MLWIGVLVMIIGGAASWMLVRQEGSREQYNQRMLGAMLCFFMALLGASTAFFSWWNTRKMTDVRLYADRLETGYGTVALRDIQQVKVEKAGRSSLIDPGQYRNETQLLVVMEKSGRAHVLPAEVK